MCEKIRNGENAMDNQYQTNGENSLIRFKEGLGELSTTLPDFAEKFNSFTEECFKEGSLSQKQKQLIALGISIQAQDEYCMIYHTKGCLDQGCTEQEILEAVAVSAAFGGGAALSQGVTVVRDCMKEFGTLH